MRLPGKSFLSPPKPDIPTAPIAAPKRSDPAITDARKKARDTALRRGGGRRSTIITGGGGVGEEGLGSTPTAGGGLKNTLG